jgi:hypothetical protein
VIVFTADTKPLKLPLTDPMAYEQALAYDPPAREKHDVSEFVRKRGRTAHEQSKEKEPEVKQEPKQEEPPKPQPKPKPQSQNQKDVRGDRERTAKPERSTEETDRKPYPKRPQGAPDYDL